MKFTLRNDYSFKLTLLGYQFPSLENVEYDSNWLNVRIDVQHPDGDWSALDPALLTYEVQELADWFRALAVGQRAEQSISFLEPCLEFHVAFSESFSELLKLKLTHGFSPPWSKGFDEFELIFPLATLNLVQAAEDLESQLARYPQRAER